MARPLRIEYAGALHYLMARGSARAEVFADDDDREAFLSELARVCERFDWVVWAYCLMGNHYHLLVETRRPTLSRGMRELNGIYTQRFNRRHRRVGPVFQGRYKSVLVDKDSYLLELSRYIVLNPVRADLCERADAWRWSSYRAVMGKAPAPDRLAVDATLNLFGTDRGVARRAYARFVAAGVEASDPTADISGQIFLGDDDFVARVTRKTQSASRQIPRTQRTWKSLKAIKRESEDRNAAIRAAYALGVYSLSEIGAHFGLHYASISRIGRGG
ncbi:MAG: transposase [Pseudomonadota bacterium]|nr:transposase [Pseudomonadota bacterium]